MFVLSLCQQLCPEKIPVKTAERLGQDGADGEVFAIVNDLNRVIKFSIIYDEDGYIDQSPRADYQKYVVPVLDYLLTNKLPVCATIYEHGCLGEYSRDMKYWKNGIQNFLIHYCIMERLFPITEDENKVFHSLISHEDRLIEKKFPSKKIEKMVEGLKRGLDFDAKMVMLFCEQLRDSKVKQGDLHSRNVMKDIDGYFKIIDFDRCDLLI